MKITDSQLYKYVPKAEKLWLSWLPTDEEIPEHIFSKRFERKMKRLIRNQRRTPRIRKIFLTAKSSWRFKNSGEVNGSLLSLGVWRKMDGMHLSANQ